MTARTAVPWPAAKRAESARRPEIRHADEARCRAVRCGCRKAANDRRRAQITGKVDRGGVPRCRAVSRLVTAPGDEKLVRRHVLAAAGPHWTLRRSRQMQADYFKLSRAGGGRWSRLGAQVRGTDRLECCHKPGGAAPNPCACALIRHHSIATAG